MKKINSEKLNNLISESLNSALADIKSAKKTTTTKSKVTTDDSKEKATKTQKVTPKPEVKSKKEKVTKEVTEINKTNLIEKVVSNREVKYIYPDDVNDTLSRKSWRQKVRAKLDRLERNMLRIQDQNSKEYKAAKKEYEQYRNTVLKAS